MYASAATKLANIELLIQQFTIIKALIISHDDNIAHIFLGTDLCKMYKWLDTLWPAGCIHLFAHCISLSSLWRLIWRHWTSKMLVRYMLSSVCLRSSQFSQLSFIQYMGLCVVSLPNFLIKIMKMCTLSCYHHQIWSVNINYCLGVRLWNSGTCCMSY